MDEVGLGNWWEENGDNCVYLEGSSYLEECSVETYCEEDREDDTESLCLYRLKCEGEMRGERSFPKNIYSSDWQDWTNIDILGGRSGVNLRDLKKERYLARIKCYKALLQTSENRKVSSEWPDPAMARCATMIV